MNKTKKILKTFKNVLKRKNNVKETVKPLDEQSSNKSPDINERLDLDVGLKQKLLKNFIQRRNEWRKRQRLPAEKGEQFENWTMKQIEKENKKYTRWLGEYEDVFD